MLKFRSLLAALACLAAAVTTTLAAEGRLLRFADIHGDRVAFVYAGDLWTVSTDGGRATRLTSHEGMELFPKFSPDGKWIAFSGEYSGSRQVYVMPADGGTPTQLTFYNDVGPMPPRGGFDYRIYGWTPDGEHVLFRANRLPWGIRMGRPYMVPAKGGNEFPTAIPEAGGGDLHRDGKTMAYTPIDREWRTWKRHRGGRAQDVWTYDLEKNVSVQLTDDPATDNQPVWVGDRIAFTSDRDGMLNLWAIDPRTKVLERWTDHRDFDVLWPSSDGSRVVYESGGRLWIFDPAVGESRELEVEIAGDFPATLPRWVDASENVGSADIGPSGKRAVFGARGDLWTVPAKDGEIRNLTNTSGVRERHPNWSPDGKWISYWSDETGEYELYVRAADGSGEPRQLTRGTAVWTFDAVWSPDGSKLAYGDKDQTLWSVDVESGKRTRVDRSETNDIQQYRWSPDGKWLTYDKQSPVGLGEIWLWSSESGETVRLSDGYTNDRGAVFDPKGRYLYFLSDRDFNLEFSGYEFNYFYVDPTRVYAALLTEDAPALLRPKSDEEQSKPDGDGEENGEGDDEQKDGGKNAKGGKKKQDAKGDDKKKHDGFRIEIDGLMHRVVALPGSAANYGQLQATESGLFFIRAGDEGPKLQYFDIESEKVEDVMTGVGGYVVSRDGKQLLYAAQGQWGITAAKPGQKPGSGKLDLSGMRALVDPTAEWKQIFRDGWRLVRDWFYDPELHGLDWDAMWDLYSPMVAHVRHRADLDYIFGELGGELNAGHFYVNWGDMPRVTRIQTGLLGAEIRPHDSGFYRIEKVFPGENWHPQFRSPLTEPGVDAGAGDFILAVDGRPVTEVKNFYELLQGKVGRDVTLTVNGEPKREGSRDTVVRPVASEQRLRYMDWVEERRRMVEELSGGRVGYIHLPNTAFDGNRELRKYFYPLADKDALILDARYNGGGFIPDRMIELVTRRTMSYWTQRGIRPFKTPGFAHDGPKACLINGYSSSGGDAFPYYFRQADLGPLIGTRTWGGLIGLQGNPGFMDGGSLSIPRFRFVSPDGRYAVENEGVSPDIEVVDRPELVHAGADPTLERAVDWLLDALEQNPPKRFVQPEAPDYGRGVEDRNTRR